MRYWVEIGGREREVHVEPQPDGRTRVRVDGRELQVDRVAFSARELMVRVDGRIMDMTVEGSPPLLGIVASGRRTYVRAESDRMRAASRAQSAGTTRRERDVRAPMPGRIVKLLVQIGDVVEPGHAVVVVEAMKMENEVRAKNGGTVAKIHCAAGDTVAANGVLVSFE